MEDKVSSDDENRLDVDMNSGGNTNVQPQATANGGHDSTSSEAGAMHNQQPPDRFQSADGTNHATLSSDGASCIEDLMKPDPQGKGFVENKSAMPGVNDHNNHFQMNAKAPPFRASTALDPEIATQILMAEALEAANQTPADVTMSSSQGKTTATMPPCAPMKLTTSKAAFEAAIKANRDLADTVLGTLQSKSREPTDNHRPGTES